MRSTPAAAGAVVSLPSSRIVSPPLPSPVSRGAGSSTSCPNTWESATGKAVGAPSVPAYATRRGDFTPADAQKIEAMRQRYLGSLKTVTSRMTADRVQRVEAKHLGVDLANASPERLTALRQAGAKLLHKGYYFTSGAGLWSRGGGQVKAVIPLNLAQLLSPAELKTLSHASDIVNAADVSAVLFSAKVDVHAKPGETADQALKRTADEVKAAAKEDIARVLKKAIADKRALSPIAMKFVQVALASKQAGRYVPFDIWTSEQTHATICQAVEAFKKSYHQLELHPDPEVQRGIVEALRAYFHDAHLHGDTHVFGMQVGYPAMRPDTGKAILDTARIGEGAGQAKAYLDQSGRTAELQRRGKELMVFENIEVFSDLPLLFGAHGETGKDVSVVVVPQCEGYAGGNPFIVQGDDGRSNFELHEQSALADEFKNGNQYFNTNTIVQPLSATPPLDVGFEYKENRTQVRAKQNAGDITKERPTAGINGRIGHEYENFKTYPDYALNGVRCLETNQEVWSTYARPN